MLLVPGSCLFQVYLGEYKYFIFLGIYLLFALTKKIYWSNYAALVTIFICVLIIWTRLIIGGAGLQILLHFTLCVLSAQFAISYNRHKFLDRWLNVVVFLAGFSLFAWIVFSIFPNLKEVWPASKYYVQTIGVDQWANDYYGKGLFLYSILEVHPTRNCGIYTEPGVYQIVLNSALIVLLFWRHRIHFRSLKQYYIYLTTILLSILTCQSTTGYIALLLILLFYITSYKNEDFYSKKSKKKIAALIGIMFGILCLNYLFLHEESIVFKQIISKLFVDGKFNFSEGSGQYRIGMIEYSLGIISNNPLGIGYDVFNSGLLKENVAASILSSMAIYGVIPILILLLLIFYPAFKYESKSFLILFMLIFLNTTLAQTDLMYPAQIMFPLYLMSIRKIHSVV